MLRDGAQTKILSCNQDLRLIRAHTSHDTQLITNTCRSIADLNKILRHKNKQYQIKSLQAKREVKQPISYPDKTLFGQEMAKVRMEQEELTAAFQKKNREKERGIEKTSLALLQSATQKDSKSASIYEYLQLMGCEEELKICRALGISDEGNQEDLQVLVECFRQMANISEPTKAKPKIGEKKHFISNVANYRRFFDELAAERRESGDRTIDWFQVLCNPKRCPLKGNVFLKTVDSLKKYWKISPYHSRKRVLLQTEALFSNMEVFIRDEARQQKFLRESLKDEDFWQKLCYLFAKGPSQYYLIQYHLKYRYEDKLLEHFTKVIQGEKSIFQPQPLLLAKDPFYRELVMLLQCNYLDYCIQNQNFSLDKLVYIALRQIALLMSRNCSFSFQLQYLTKAAARMTNQFKNAIAEKQSEKVSKLTEALFSLGQFSSVFDIFFHFQAISTLQYIILLALVFQSDIAHSKLLLYDPSKIQLALKDIIIKIVKEIKSFDTEDYLALLQCMLPAFASQGKSFIIKVITLNRLIFEYLIEFIGFPLAAERLCLSVEDFSNIIRICMERHSNYAYCLQLGISSCINLHDLSKLIQSQKNDKEQKITKLYKKSSHFQNKDLNLLMGASERFLLDQHNKFSILIDCMKILIQTNLSLLHDNKRRQESYEEITSINELYQQLGKEKVSPHILAFLHQIDEETASRYDQSLKDHKDMIVLTYNMIRIKMSIFNRQFQAIVDILNCIFYEICENFNKTIKNLQSLSIPFQIKDLLIIFMGDIIQSLLFLQSKKPKVIDRNRVILRQICKQLHSLLSILSPHDSHSSIFFGKLQEIMTSLSHFSVSR